jgi:predicted nucleic acid-binding protein
MAIIVDTSSLYALVDADDRYHEAVTQAVLNNQELLIVPILILPEISYLVNKFLGVEVEVQILTSIIKGELRVEETKMADISRAVELIEKYKEHKVGLVDAIVVATAERLKVSQILTLDKRHFSLMQPKHISAFELLP